MADIRLATADDAPTVVHHRNRMFAEMGHGTPQSRAQMDVNFDIWVRPKLVGGTYLGWFACVDEHIVAGAGLYLVDWGPSFDGFVGQMPYLMNVYTEPDFRKRGLARRVVEEAIHYCERAGFPRMRLHASEFGRPLYETLGFKLTNEMQLNM